MTSQIQTNPAWSKLATLSHVHLARELRYPKFDLLGICDYLGIRNIHDGYVIQYQDVGDWRCLYQFGSEDPGHCVACIDMRCGIAWTDLGSTPCPACMDYESPEEGDDE